MYVAGLPTWLGSRNKPCLSTGEFLARPTFRFVYVGGKTGLLGEVANGALSEGGEGIGVIIPCMSTPAPAHVGITRMEVVPDLHRRTARMHELSQGYYALPAG